MALKRALSSFPEKGKTALLLYRQPNGNLEKFRERLSPKLNHLNNCVYEVCIIGDIINIDFYKCYSLLLNI